MAFSDFISRATPLFKYVILYSIYCPYLVAVETQDDDVVLKEAALGGREELVLRNVQQLDRESFSVEKFEGLVLFHLQRCESVLSLYSHVGL